MADFHPAAIVESPHIGGGTHIAAFAHVLAGARIGRDCRICGHTLVENDVIIGDRVTIQAGVQVWDGIRIEDDVLIGPNATFTGNHPRGKDLARTQIKRGATIGANATIAAGVTVGEHALIEAGAVITHDVPTNAVVSGNPARIVGYTGLTGATLQTVRVAAPTETGSRATEVAGVVVHRLPVVDDLRGQLTFAEMLVHVPFEVKRCFLVYDVASEHIRGEHSHRTLHQFLLCVHGSCHVVADDGVNRQEFVLDSPSIGIYLPPMIWGVQYRYSADAVLLVLASAPYDPADYIRSYDEFLRLKRAAQR
jgi:acetyltransferase-like isoleucine patch superfamily enzyme/dTDP-4-dehydrorhamnose 3,5-epimerase-like enzyme